ncbi:MAG: hypothetical protein GF398_03335 [Chitinivibrionales bacterium]|nr:hypothetical protein [Chitinivibrionales bacterium]
MKRKVIITGATGNVGRALLTHIDTQGMRIVAASRNAALAHERLSRDDIEYVDFDLEKGIGFEHVDDAALVFLLRPPQVGNVARYVYPLLDRIAEKHHTKVVFLSVMGAERMSYIPHAKIEQRIRQLTIPSVFLRPGYFMDNITTTLYDEIKANRRIFMPSGGLKFNWIDVDDIGRLAAKVIFESDAHVNTAVEIAGGDYLGFGEVVDRINAVCATSLRYESPSVMRYIWYKLTNGTPLSYIGIMLLLHYLPRFGRQRQPVNDFERIMQSRPSGIEQFIMRNCRLFNTERSMS